ncbi:MAG: mobile mystery protein A [Coxiellaceae bacterium]|nr:mobile mystery protein A [Coxiellaceae bacterium]
MNQIQLIINQLESQLAAWKTAKRQLVPKKGWLRMLRSALGLSSYQLARRMAVSQSRVAQLERSEVNGSVTLKSLSAAAEAMNCQLVYAIVPKESLQTILETQARKVAKKRIERVSHSMTLEAQTVSKEKQREQYEALVNELLTGSPKKLWNEE